MSAQLPRSPEEQRHGRRILYFSYWSSTEPLTDSTLIPYFRFLQEMPEVERVHFVTVERDGKGAFPWKGLDKVVHIPVPMRWKALPPLARFEVIQRVVRRMTGICKRERIDVIGAKGAVAGLIAAKVAVPLGIPYIVESFEPHADYMADSGVWSRKGPYYRYAKRHERHVKSTAARLVTVTNGYRDRLIADGLDPGRISMVPSVTDITRFRFSPEDRRRVRAELGIGDRPTGIYVGKFGGLYYREEAFSVFSRMNARLGGEMHLLLLTNEPEAGLRKALVDQGIPVERISVRFAPHQEVPAYLSAADLAFSTIRYIPHGRYQSPVKNGEYWANGLPILLTHGVSDDHVVIQERPYAGALFRPDLADLDAAVDHMAGLVHAPGGRDRIMALGEELRSMEIARRAYQRLFGGGEAAV
ncbi:MAG TPA: glycosyltransferase [Flavobacteriales bacterium]